MACSWRVYDCVIDEVGSQLTDGAVVAFAKAIGDATAKVLESLNGVWLNVGVKDSSGPVAEINTEVDWLVGYIAVASLLIAAIRMALDRKGQPMKQAFLGMWKVILVGAVAVPVVQALTLASDAYAQDVYRKAELGEQAAKILGVLSLKEPGLVLVFGLLVMLSSFVQICLMYIRIGVMIMLVGTLPLAAVSSMTGWGEGWWKKHIGWLAAWLLYKPAAALIIYSATSMTHGTKEINQTIAGMGMLVMAVFALPALLKLIVPATAALGGTSGGTVTLNAVNNVATGAVAIAAGGAAAGANGAPGPQGSPSTGAGTSAGGAGGMVAGGGGAAAAGGVAAGAQVAAVAIQTGVAAASEVANSLNDNDGMKGHNQ